MYNFNKVTSETNFFEGNSPFELIKNFGSPLYIYNEKILRKKCREMKNLVKYPNFSVNYSAKANSNLAFLEIVKEEGLDVDAMSIGEMSIELKAGFKPEQIFYISNNASDEEMQFAVNKNILISVDSLSQLERYGKINPNSNIAVRFNGGFGVGHHEKVITAGKNTKFGINSEYVFEVKSILNKYNLKLVGVNQHIGSLFMNPDEYIKGVDQILKIAKNFDTLEFIDLGGGFGIPYNKLDENYNTLNLKKLGNDLDYIFSNFSKKYNPNIKFKIEPGRYISAECGIILGTVNSIKNNAERKYVGTDIGFNVLLRPALYDSHHDIEVFSKSPSSELEEVTVVGNICETGDIIAKNRLLPKIEENDILAVLDSGAYGFVMSSNYNNRLRPAEVLIRENGRVDLIRHRDNLEDMFNKYIPLKNI